MSITPTLRCPQCATEIAPGLLSCPSCRRLVHGEQLKALAASADAAETNGDISAAMATWREALELLPPDSRQYQIIASRIEALVTRVPRVQRAGLKPVPAETRPSGHGIQAGARSPFGKAAAGVGAGALLLWKFKFILTFILTKGKLLLLGLTKSSTFFSMFLSAAVYWSAMGWPLAVGLVLSIYVHEMGHVEALRRYGFRASAPMFIPGFGALVRLHQHPTNPSEDARIGLAGPLWGLGAALVCYIVFYFTRAPIWAAIAQLGAWINLFNLLPVWQLDGGRGFSPLSRKESWFLVLLIAAAWFYTSEGLLFLILIVAALRAFAKSPTDKGDRPALLTFAALVIILSLMTRIHVPI